jgi:hypothetical protein
MYYFSYGVWLLIKQHLADIRAQKRAAQTIINLDAIRKQNLLELQVKEKIEAYKHAEEEARLLAQEEKLLAQQKALLAQDEALLAREEAIIDNFSKKLEADAKERFAKMDTENLTEDEKDEL